MSEAAPVKKDSVPKPIGRSTRTIRALLVMCILGIGLGAWNAFTTRRDVAVATGTPSPAQLAFFLDAVDRPDMPIFFKSLTAPQRLSMAKNLAAHSDKRLPKLVAVLLNDFDAAARKELAMHMAALAKAYPEEVAVELKNRSSFQSLAIIASLREAGDAAIPAVVKQLAVADARANASALLVELGPKSAPLIIALLDDKDRDTRLAAADTLGKQAATAAVGPLIAKYRSAPADEVAGYLSAIAAIGDASTEGLLSDALLNARMPVAMRAQAAIGLGRIASPSACRSLWRVASEEDLGLLTETIAGLQVAGDRALAASPAQLNPQIRLRVAAGIRTENADTIIREKIGGEWSAEASRAAVGRPSLVPDLRRLLQGLDPNTQGDVADEAILALMSTEPGRRTLDAFAATPVAGLIDRRRLLAGG